MLDIIVGTKETKKGIILLIPVTTKSAKKKIVRILEECCSSKIVICNDIEEDYMPAKINCICKKGTFREWAGFSDVALAMSGTATEQCVALGIPVISLVGEGPQFNSKFALKQKDLLGESLILTKTIQEAASKLEILLSDQEEARRLGNMGISRMRADGGSREIARFISNMR